MTDLELSGLPVLSPIQRRQRLSLLIWGTSGCGKTTLAATAPGRKLWINFDPDGTESLLGRDDILIADFSREPSACDVKFREENPIRIEKFITDNDIDTVVFDSLTSYGEKALHYITVAQGAKRKSDGTITPPQVLGTIIKGVRVPGWWQPTTCDVKNNCGAKEVLQGWLWPQVSACHGIDDEAEEADKMAVHPAGNVYIIDDRYRVAKINGATDPVVEVIPIPGYDARPRFRTTPPWGAATPPTILPIWRLGKGSCTSLPSRTPPP